MELTISRKREFKNKELQKATTRIRKAGEAVRINCYKIASELAYIHNNKLWVEDGYNDIADYALKILRLKKSMCYDLIRIGNTLTAENGRESILHRPDGCREDFTVGQLKVMLPLGADKMCELTDDEIVTPDMSVRQIQRITRNNKEDYEAEADTEAIEDPEADLDAVESEPPEPVITIADGELFTTDYFDQLTNVQLVKIVTLCKKKMYENYSKGGTSFTKEEILYCENDAKMTQAKSMEV